MIGEAGTGKTESLNRIFRTHPALVGYGTPGSGCPLRSVSVPAPCTPKALGNAILRGVDYPVARELKEHVLWALVQEKLADAGVLLLHLDEMHNLTSNANITQIDNIRKTLKSLMVSPQWPIGLIISGLPELAPEMQAIDELRRRGRFVRRPLLVAPGDVDLVRGIVEGCADIAAIVISQDSTTDIAHRLLQASLGRFGMMIEIVHEAIEQCLIDGRPLSLEHFATAYFDRTGCGSKMNPFLAPNWHEIDCALVLASELPFDPGMPSAPLRPSRVRHQKRGGK